MLALFRTQMPARMLVQQALPSGAQAAAQSCAYCSNDYADRKSDGNGPEAEGAKSAVNTAAQGAASLLNSAKDAVTGSEEADDAQSSAAGKMQQKRDAGGPDQHPADRIGEVKENAKDGRDINDAFPDMAEASKKTHRTGA